MYDLPRSWREFLGVLQNNGCPEAVIVGGALRDLENIGLHAVKDVDVFVSSGRAETILDTLNASLKNAAISTMVPTYRSFSDVHGVHVVVWKGWEFQVIPTDRCNGMASAGAACDFGICQIETNGSYIARTSHYLQDQRDKTFTLINAADEDAVKRSLRRYGRLREKYPGWAFRMKEGLCEEARMC